MAATAIVSGGTGGLGSAVVTELLDREWRVVVPWIVESELERLPASDRLVAVEADLFDAESTRRVVELADDSPDRPLRGVVNLVGGFAMGPRLHETPIDDFDHLMRLNLRPLYQLSRAALPSLVAAGGGSIVGVSAKAAFAPFSGASAYVTAKAAVWALISSLAVEYSGDNIRANAVLPSVIDTAANRESQPDSTRAGWVDPAEIARTIAFLLSEESSAITGAQIPVPGAG